MEDTKELELFKSLREEMKHGINMILDQITEIKNTIKEYQTLTNNTVSDLRVLAEKSYTLDKRLTDNFIQHKEFFDKFNQIEKEIDDRLERHSKGCSGDIKDIKKDNEDLKIKVNGLMTKMGIISFIAAGGATAIIKYLMS